jgi:hypothetical protein
MYLRTPEDTRMNPPLNLPITAMSIVGLVPGTTSTMLPDLVNQTTQPPTTFPLTTPGLMYTYASYGQQPVPTGGSTAWRLCLSIPIPYECIAPTLTSLVYIIKYASKTDKGNSTVQADTILTTVTCPVGITNEQSDPTGLRIYHSASNCGYGSHIVDNKVAMCLSSVPAVKYNVDNSGSWNHYIDHHRLIPNVRITKPSNLYLIFHVYEYSATDRALSVEVSAVWLCKHDMGSDKCSVSM